MLLTCNRSPSRVIIVFVKGWKTKSLIISDLHGVFVDSALLEQIIVLASNKKEKFTHLILNGDIIDFPMISKFVLHTPGNPRLQDLQYEIDCVVDYILRPIRRALPNIDLCYVMGNHEERLMKYLCGNAKPLASLRCLNLPELLKFGELGIKFFPHRLEIGGAFDGFIYHGTRCGKTASKNEVEHHKCNVICGHTHKDGYYKTTGYHGNVSCWHTGHSADKSQIDKNCKYSEYMYWAQSIGVLENSENYYNFQSIEVKKSGFNYNGKTYR